jgi:hypothetical protein
MPLGPIVAATAKEAGKKILEKIGTVIAVDTARDVAKEARTYVKKKIKKTKVKKKSTKGKKKVAKKRKRKF